MNDFYATLGVERKASQDQIKAAWRKKAMELHPDRLSEEEKEVGDEAFKNAEEAYRCLSDPQRRKVYDQTGLDSGAASILSDALDSVTALAAMAIDDNYADVLSYIQGSLEGARLEAESKIMECERRIKMLARKKGMVRKRKPGDNLMDRIIDKKVAETKASINVENRVILVQLAAFEILSDYYTDDQAIGTTLAKPRPPVRLGS